MNRAQRAQRIVQLEQLAAYAQQKADDLRVDLATEAHAEYQEHGSVPSWRFPGVAQIGLTVGRRRTVVADESAFTGYVLSEFPDEIEPKVRQQFRKILLERLIEFPDGLMDPGTGQFVPGVRIDHGGQPRDLRVNPDNGYVGQIQQALASRVETLTASVLPALDGPEEVAS